MTFINKDKGDQERLYKLLEHVESTLDGLESDVRGLKEAGATDIQSELRLLQEQVEGWKEIKERFDAIDKALPKGEKRYVSPDTEGNSAKREFVRDQLGRWLINGACQAMGNQKRFEVTEIAQQYAVDADGGYLVPDLFMQEIQIIRERYGFVRQNFRVIPVPTGVKHVPLYDGGPEVEWVDEGATTSENTKVTFTRKSLTTKRLMAIQLFSWEIMEWSDPSIIPFVVDLTGEKLAKEEDRVGLRGDITGNGDPFNGAIITAGNVFKHPVAGELSFGDITYEDLINTQDAVNEFVVNESKWCFSNHVKNRFRMIRAGAAVYDSTANQTETVGNVGFPLWLANLAGSTPGQLLEAPYEVSPVMPKVGDDGVVDAPVALFGDFRRAMVLADGKQVSVKFSEHFDFKRANVVMRTMETVGFKDMLPDAMALLTTAGA